MDKMTKPRVDCSECGGIKDFGSSIRVCDKCEKRLYGDDYLRALANHEDFNKSRELHFCDWNCAIPFLRTFDGSAYSSVMLPHLMRDPEYFWRDEGRFWELFDEGAIDHDADAHSGGE